MKLKLSQLVNATPALSRLIQQPMKAQYSFPLSRLAAKIEPELKTYDAARMKLLSEYGKLSGDGQQYIFESDEQAKEFASELQTVLDSEIELEFKLLLLDKLDRVELSAADFAVLDWLIVDRE